MVIFTEYQLPNGVTIKNRIAKAAMEEGMAMSTGAPSKEMMSLYRRWSMGGAGLLISGNVMLDKRFVTAVNTPILEDDRHMQEYRAWAQAAKVGGSKVLLQVNHPGRQAPANLVKESMAPSAINLNMGKYSNMFAPARAMTELEIEEVIERFVTTARLTEKAGFDGMQIHAAHGYLLSQFLSPLANKRDDQWGGSLENRARLLLTVVKKVRAVVSKNFIVAVKLNSADFQRDGFQLEDAKQVVKMLEQYAVDFIELSGGSYEVPAMQGATKDERNLSQEAYFLEFASKIAQSTSLPIMTTGGIRRRAVAERVLLKKIRMVGIATGLALMPELPNRWQDLDEYVPSLNHIGWRNKTLAIMAKMAQIKGVMRRHAKSQKLKSQLLYWLAFLIDQWVTYKGVKEFKQQF